MSFISVFDVLGPNMIGPSSSHTAGAAAIALLARKMMNRELVRADFTFRTDLPGTRDRPGSSGRDHGLFYR